MAREAVRKSLVLLKNDDQTLPLSRQLDRIHVAGKNADDVGNQCGGWTIEWQGKSGEVTTGGTADPGEAQCQADLQDCPDGFKCVLRRGAADWEFVCLPVQGDHQVGDACTGTSVTSGSPGRVITTSSPRIACCSSVGKCVVASARRTRPWRQRSTTRSAGPGSPPGRRPGSPGREREHPGRRSPRPGRAGTLRTPRSDRR